MSNLTDSAVLEIARLQGEAAQLIQLPNLTQSDRKKADLLISQISSIRSLGVSTDEIRQLATARDPQLKKAEAERVAHERAFRAYCAGGQKRKSATFRLASKPLRTCRLRMPRLEQIPATSYRLLSLTWLPKARRNLTRSLIQTWSP